MVENERHVTPTDDLIHHPLDEDCPCGPTPKLVSGVGWVLVHHSLDGREAAEPREDR